jgi:hypothetical protein
LVNLENLPPGGDFTADRHLHCPDLAIRREKAISCLTALFELTSILVERRKEVMAKLRYVKDEVRNTINLFHRKVLVPPPSNSKAHKCSVELNVCGIVTVNKTIPENVVERLCYRLERTGGEKPREGLGSFSTSVAISR